VWSELVLANETKKSLSKVELTKRERAATDELDALKELNKSVLDSISDILLVIDPNDYKIVGANEAALKRLKFRKEDLVGRFCYEVTHRILTPCKPPHDVCPIQELLKTGNSVAVEHTHFDKDNNRIYVEVSAHPIRNRAGKIILVTHIAKDITEKKQMQEELLKSERLATIGELALQLANDLRNPLQAIQGATYWLKGELSRLQSPPKGLEILQAINDSVRYSDKIVKDLLDFASAKTPMFKKTSVNALVKDTLSHVELPKNVELITELAHLPQIEADEDMLKRVFLNITTNGIQAMADGGQLRVSTRKTKGFVEVSFIDSGIGISKEELGKLFKPLFTTKSRGMGLGLAICKRLIDAHGGGIEAESEAEKGTTFTVKLPIRQSEVKSCDNIGSNILVVKNNVEVLEYAKNLVSKKSARARL
jgi:two-component system NtrC family sensor kinase